MHLKVRDLNRSIEFYTKHIGLQVGERVGTYAFLNDGKDHHTIALQELGAAPSPDDYMIGLYHVAFEVPDIGSLRESLDRLKSERVPHTAVDHGISFAVYFSDPDGNGLEIYLDRRSDLGGASEWTGRSRVLTDV